MKTGFISAVFLLVIAALVAVGGYLVFTEKAVAPVVEEQISIPETATTTSSNETVATTSPATLLQSCPDQWVDNRMPMALEPGQPRPVTQYFIYHGERREIAEYDMSWVKANCSTEPSVVY